MRKPLWSRVFRGATGAALLLGGTGIYNASSASGAEGCCTPAPTAGYCCGDCDRIFTNAGDRLSDDLARLTAECCAPTCAPTAGCNGGCVDECGWCNLGEPWDLGDALFDNPCDPCHKPLFDIGGWTQIGYHSHNVGAYPRFNQHPHRVNLHQQWLYAERIADGSNGPDWGFRFDAMYGVDAADTQAFGNNPGRWDFMNGYDHGIYGFALPQAYVEVANGDWSVKAGHFFTLVGYEVVTAPDNFFYSHAFTMYNSEPFTHTGVLGTYKASEDVTLYSGWTLGWDTGFDRFDDGSNFLGGASVGLNDEVTVTYITTIGDLGWRGEGYSHSVVVDTKVTEKLNYVLQSDLVETNAGNDHQFGVNQYLFYTINDCLAAGTRAEWWKNAGNSQYATTFGVNIKPHANLIFRPEVRHDWNPGLSENFTTFGIDAIVTY